MTAFDYIIVGGGSAGCVLANRLSADPSNTVLLIEAGGEDDNLMLHIPAGFYKLMNDRRYNWCFATEPEDATDGRVIGVPRGKVLGGSSAINGSIWVRGQPLDYDTWSQLGNQGWSYESVLPYFKRFEAFAPGDPGKRGIDGPVNVVVATERHEILDAFIGAAEACGYPRNTDYNDGDQEGFGYYQYNQRNGRRVSAATAFLKPARRRPNLTVTTGAQVTRVVLDGRRAVAVRYRRAGTESEARCNGEVILSAGAVQTPQLLELSGIGRGDLLQSLGIDVLHPLEGVGENFRDHYGSRVNWRGTLPITLNELSRGFSFYRELARYFVTRRGILTYGAGAVFGFVRTRPELAGPDVQIHFTHASYGNAQDRRLDDHPGMTAAVCVLRPESRGSIHITSPDPAVPPAIRPNFLSAAEDREGLVAGLKIARRIGADARLDRYREAEKTPGDAVGTDAEWLAFARANGQTLYHVSGTARMGRDPMAVVDPELRVHGLQGLRVVDASVMPTLVSGNTNAAVMMIAEKASDMILDAARRRAAA